MESPQNLACDHMKIHISLQLFQQFNFEGIIMLFDLEYFFKEFLPTTNTVGISQIYVCLLITIQRFTYHYGC
jgi:hypothetical protein